MIFPALSALLLQTGLVFSDVKPWRWSEGRGEFIPALAATADNRSGEDFESVRVLVRVRCAAGGTRSYHVTLRDVLLGAQPVEATAYDAIGSVPYCEGRAEAVALEASPYPAARRPAFAVLGFAARRPDGAISTELEGILDYRDGPGASQSLLARTWRRQGARICLAELPDTAFYVIRVPPGRLGLAGFLLDQSPEPRSPVSRFLRFYEIPPGEARWLGVFRLELQGPGKAALTLEPSPALAARLAARLPRPLLPARAVAPPSGSTLVTQ
jgi:hypothetical protein